MAKRKHFGDLSNSELNPAEQEVLWLVDGYLEDLSDSTAWGASQIELAELAHGKRIQDEALPEQLAVMHAAMVRMVEWSHGHEHNWDEVARLSWLATKLLRMKLPVTEDDLIRMIDSAILVRRTFLWLWPLGGLLGTIEKFVKAGSGLPNGLKPALERLAPVANENERSEVRKHAPRIAKILGGTEGHVGLAPSEWGRAATEAIEGLEASSRDAWAALLGHAVNGGGKASPSAKWLAETGPLVAAVGVEVFGETLAGWLGGLTLDPQNPEPNTDILKGLIWAAGTQGDDALAPDIARFCERCFRKVPGIGPPAVKLGNACLITLGAMTGDRAAAQLVRLRGRIKQAQPKGKIEAALAAAAERAGLTVADLEEIALPTFGLDGKGCRKDMLGDVTAEISITGSDEITLSWTGADGKARKAAPASVKADHADELKSLRAEIKEIKGLLSGQRWRLESLYLAQRSWPLADWRKRYLEHPLMANLARRLIWKFGEVAAVPVGEGLVGVDGKEVSPVSGAIVSPWHPIEVAADEVLAWRRRLAALEITQPFKQAHREIYVLTDAERATNVYSNRFAAHVLRQHQMNALCQARGWRYNMQGAWDQEESVPTLHLPNWGLSVEFWVNHASDDYLESGIYVYRATDQVRFLDPHEGVVPLERVPPLVLSEAMRDVDLFVGVASVGNNPEWRDGGPEGRFRDYWWGFSFGELGETAKTRKAVLEVLLPKLKIADLCELKDKFLNVRGTKRTYKIHLGSGNILMTPNDEYLCIVPEQGKAAKGGDNLRLPFEGDRTLSLIISKAFMLAADDKITDRTILSQIGG